MNFYCRCLLSILVLFSINSCTKSSSDGDDSSSEQRGQFDSGCSLRVVNGRECTPHEGPLAAIGLFQDGSFVGACSGAFISPSKVLTAAHCFELIGANGAVVISGGQRSTAEVIHTHPSFYAESRNTASPYDVAVIQLRDSLQVDTLPLLLGESPRAGQTLNVFGFGLDERGNMKNPTEAVAQGFMVLEGRYNDLLIARPGDGEQSVCPGDSGGPGIVLNHDDRPAILGVANAVLGTDYAANERCENVAGATFVDVQLPAVLNWILSVAPETDGI